VSSQGTYAGRKLPALPPCTVDAEPAKSGFFSACVAQSDAASSALPADPAICFHVGAFERFTPLRDICRASNYLLAHRDCRAALQDSCAASHRGPGQRVSGAQGSGRCWALQVSLFAGPPLEDMDVE